MEKTATAKKRGSFPGTVRKRWYVFALAGIALLSFWLNFYAISRLGYGNAYYAAAIKSMMQSWHNFFYVSFDPAGVVSVDKPPLGLWVQCLFCFLFGYHGWAMLLPQALAGAGSAVMMYVLTAKRFGRPAGLIAALVFALTPAAVVASRNNTMDMQLIFVLLAAAWFLFRSMETGRWRYLFAAGALVGLGFNIKTLQAYMILPAAAAAYLLCAKEKPGRRLLAGAVSLVVLAAVSFAWVAAVDLTPSGSRPYVGSSSSNTEWDLLTGYNGIQRLSGGMGGAGGNGTFRNDGRGTRTDGANGWSAQNGNNAGVPAAPNQNQNGGTGNSGNRPAMPNRNGGNTGNAANGGAPSANGQNGFAGNAQGGFRLEGMGTGNGGMGGVGNDIGTAGPFRLWQQSMYGQASWLILPALFCILACVRRFKWKKMTPKQGIFLFWVVWLAVVAVFFSFASFFHRYYLCMLAPGIAGVVGIGFPEMLRAFRGRKGWKQWLLPLTVIGSGTFSALYVWNNYPALRSWLVPLVAGAGAAALVLMAVFLLRPKKALALAAAGMAAVSLLAGPFYWSLTATLYVCENITMPYAGPELASTSKTPGMTRNQETFTSSDSAAQSLENYLVKHYRSGSYLVVAQSANDVAQFIVDTGLPAVAYGGFLGSDNAWSLDRFKQLVEEGRITYVLASSDGRGGGIGGSSEILSYVKSNAKQVSASAYGGSSSQGGTTLYVFDSGTKK